MSRIRLGRVGRVQLSALAEEAVTCAEVDVVLQDDATRGAFPVITRVEGLRDVEPFTAPLRRSVENFSSTFAQHNDSSQPQQRRVWLRISDGIVLQVNVLTLDGGSRRELVALLGTDVLESERGVELGRIMSSTNPGDVPASAAALSAIPRVAIDTSHARPCVICCEDFVLGAEALRLGCEHTYHERCIYSWLKRYNSCPVCRTSVPEPKKELNGEEDIRRLRREWRERNNRAQHADSGRFGLASAFIQRLRHRTVPASESDSGSDEEDAAERANEEDVYSIDIVQVVEGEYRLILRLPTPQRAQNVTTLGRRVLQKLMHWRGVLPAAHVY